MTAVGSPDASRILRNLSAAWLANVCFDPDSEPFQFVLRSGMFARLGE